MPENKEINDKKEEKNSDRKINLEGQKEKILNDNNVIEEEISEPSFMPTFQVKAKYFPLPIILVVILSGILAYLSYIVSGIQIEGVIFPESEYGGIGALLNGLIFIGYAAVSSFIMIYIIKKKGINALKYIFAFSFAILCFFLLILYGDIILWLITKDIFENELYIIVSNIMYVCIGAFTIFMIYKYVKGDSLRIKNIFILLIGLLIGAFMGMIIPPITTIIILILISIWDIYAVKSKRGPIKKMFDIVLENSPKKEKIKKLDEKAENEEYEVEYDISSLEIGIGDLAFYSMLTSHALIFTNNIVILIATACAVILGTGITILGLKKNKILPGLPISIFLGLGTMLLTNLIFSIL